MNKANYDDIKSMNIACGDILTDLKIFMAEHYVGTVENNGESLTVTFDNGQKFKVTATELK